MILYLRALPKDVTVAHKTGEISGVRHDAGIVFLPDGRKYVLVLLSKRVKDVPKAVEEWRKFLRWFTVIWRRTNNCPILCHTTYFLYCILLSLRYSSYEKILDSNLLISQYFLCRHIAWPVKSHLDMVSREIMKYGWAIKCRTGVRNAALFILPSGAWTTSMC